MEKTVETMFVEKRSGIDRRADGFFSGLHWFFKTGRRRQVRRQSDLRKLRMLDYYSPKLLVMFVIILLLSVTDALLTLWLIDNGAIEINPVMAYYIELGPQIFIGTKYLLTVSIVTMGVLFNYARARFFRIRFGHILNLSACCFATVVAWEIYLICQVTG